MPIYTYKCKQCGKVFEKMKSMGANGNEFCEDCNSEAIRVFLPAGIIFKGSGFYSTDYKSGSGNAVSGTDSRKEERKEEKKEEKKEDSKETGKQQEVSKPDLQAVKTPGKPASSGISEKVKM